MKTRFTDPGYLRWAQYRGEGNLRARIRLHERFSVNPYGMQRWVFDQLDLPASCALLELGCGPGDLWVQNRARIPPGWRALLTDLSEGMAHQARKRLGDQTGWSFLAADAQAIPFPDRSFDAVIADHMLYHVPDRARAFAEIQRVLRPGGRFYATTNGPAHLQELDALITRFAPAQNGASWHTGAGGGINFDLENGPRQVRAWFSGVDMARYPDALVVTEVEPLLDYVRSMVPEGMETTALAEMAAVIGREIAERGMFKIAKDVGIIKGMKDDGREV